MQRRGAHERQSFESKVVLVMAADTAARGRQANGIPLISQNLHNKGSESSRILSAAEEPCVSGLPADW